MNDALRILTSLAREIQKTQSDPPWAREEAAYDRLQKEFWIEHQKNPTLLSQVDDMLFSQCLLSEYHSEFHFLLGLQIGLELGSLDLLRGTMEQEIRFRPDL